MLSETNKCSLTLFKEYSDQLDIAIAKKVRHILDLNESDDFKLSLIAANVNNARHELRKFESSLEWEDEE